MPYMPGQKYQRVWVEPGVRCDERCEGSRADAGIGCGEVRSREMC